MQQDFQNSPQGPNEQRVTLGGSQFFIRNIRMLPYTHFLEMRARRALPPFPAPTNNPDPDVNSYLGVRVEGVVYEWLCRVFPDTLLTKRCALSFEARGVTAGGSQNQWFFRHRQPDVVVGPLDNPLLCIELKAFLGPHQWQQVGGARKQLAEIMNICAPKWPHLKYVAVVAYYGELLGIADEKHPETIFKGQPFKRPLSLAESAARLAQFDFNHIAQATFTPGQGYPFVPTLVIDLPAVHAQASTSVRIPEDQIAALRKRVLTRRAEDKQTGAALNAARTQKHLPPPMQDLLAGACFPEG
jgi:hypothetical protein